eukprot:scaffold3851_cov387-Prasinococcus_capsulatus_cf.AAC.5
MLLLVLARAVACLVSLGCVGGRPASGAQLDSIRLRGWAYRWHCGRSRGVGCLSGFRWGRLGATPAGYVGPRLPRRHTEWRGLLKRGLATGAGKPP